MDEAKFLKDVAGHTMEVLRDDGVYRHIRFRQSGTMCMYFDLVTWPGYLCYTGDMGTYVFSRLTDMFEFFRTDRAPAQRRGRQLGINRSYWSEKLEAVDGSRIKGSAKEFSPDKFARVIKEQLVQWWRNRILTREQRTELRKAVEESVLDSVHDSEHEACIAARDFDERIGEQRFEFVDLWEHDFTDYTHRFTWCCYALAWGIQTYDAAADVVRAGKETPCET